MLIRIYFIPLRLFPKSWKTTVLQIKKGLTPALKNYMGVPRPKCADRSQSMLHEFSPIVANVDRESSYCNKSQCPLLGKTPAFFIWYEFFLFLVSFRKIWEIHLTVYRNFFSALLQVHPHFLYAAKQPDCSQSNSLPLFLNNSSWFITPSFQICFFGSGVFLRSVYNTKNTPLSGVKPDSFLTLFKAILIFYGKWTRSI